MTDTTTTSYKVTVHKANVPLKGAESLRQFTCELSKQLKPKLIQKFNGGDKSDAWPLEVYANKAVFMVIPEWEDVTKDVTVAFEYERADNGDFAIVGEVQKVKAVTQWEVTKRAELPKAMSMESWTPDIVEAPAKAVAKSFWGGVL